MDLVKLYVELKKLGFWNQAGIFSGFIAVILGILALAGVHMQLLDLSFLLFSCGFLLLFYGNVRQSQKLSEAKEALSQVDNKIDQAVASVYSQKKAEIDKLEMEIAVWKDKAAIQQEERHKAEQEISELVNLSKKLTDQLGKDNRARQIERLRAQGLYDDNEDKTQTKEISYQVDTILDITTPEDVLYNEAVEAFKKYDKKG